MVSPFIDLTETEKSFVFMSCFWVIQAMKAVRKNNMVKLRRVSIAIAGNVYGLAMWRNSVIRQPVTEAKFIIKCSLFILLPGVSRLPKPEPTNDIQPIVYSSSRHIAKPHVTCILHCVHEDVPCSVYTEVI